MEIIPQGCEKWFHHSDQTATNLFHHSENLLKVKDDFMLNSNQF